MSDRDPDAVSDNRVLDVGAIPRLDAGDFRPLDPAFRRLRTITSALVAVGATIAAAGVVTTSSNMAISVIAAVAWLVVLAACVAHRLAADHMAYLVRELDVSFRSGLLSRSVATVPFARVQHVGIQRGPLDRRLGLAALTVRTAGGGITVPGIADDVAERLKQLVTARAVELADAEIDMEIAEEIAEVGIAEVGIAEAETDAAGMHAAATDAVEIDDGGGRHQPLPPPRAPDAP